MKIYLIMYRQHERSGYTPIMAFKDKKHADDVIKSEIGSATDSPAFILREIDVKDW